MVHLRCKGENHQYLCNKQYDLPQRKSSKLIYFAIIWIYDTWDVITNFIVDSFNFIIIEKLTESLLLCLCLLLSFLQVQSPIQLLVNIWNFLLQTKKKIHYMYFPVSTHFVILRNFCFLFLNWQQVVNVSHDRQHVTIRKLKRQCIKLHRMIKQIYIDNG